MDPSLAPAGTFVGANSYDPLRHNPSDFFWFHIEPCFKPFQQEDIVALQELPSTAHSRTEAPLAQRIVAALLDEGKGANAAARALRVTASPEPMCFPGTLPSLRTHGRIFDSRLHTELENAGVFRPGDEDLDVEQVRLDAWHLRNLASANIDSIGHVATQVVAEVNSQVARRQSKRRSDQSEVEYIKKMMETKSKRDKSRFSKLLREMHPHYDLPIGAPLPGTHANGETVGGGSHDRKKKKRKSSHHDRHKSSSKHDANKHERFSAGYNA